MMERIPKPTPAQPTPAQPTPAQPMSDAERQRLFRQRRKARDQALAGLLLALWDACPDDHRAAVEADPDGIRTLRTARKLAGRA